MKHLQLKPEYQGVIITKNIFNIGTVTFDTLKITEQHHFRNYFDLGFDFCFEETPTEYKAPIQYRAIEQESVVEFVKQIEEPKSEEPIVNNLEYFNPKRNKKNKKDEGKA